MHSFLHGKIRHCNTTTSDVQEPWSMHANHHDGARQLEDNHPVMACMHSSWSIHCPCTATIRKLCRQPTNQDCPSATNIMIAQQNNQPIITCMFDRSTCFMCSNGHDIAKRTTSHRMQPQQNKMAHVQQRSCRRKNDQPIIACMLNKPSWSMCSKYHAIAKQSTNHTMHAHPTMLAHAEQS